MRAIGRVEEREAKRQVESDSEQGHGPVLLLDEFDDV